MLASTWRLRRHEPAAAQPADRFRQEPHRRATGRLFERLPDPFGGAGVEIGCDPAVYVGAPIIALDDIVTSYDVDHRRTIAGLITTMFGGSQILITTHDERSFNCLKDQLEAKAWHFTRIIGPDPAYGPRFADHKVSDEMIEARWAAGQSAANEMRQAEEEWLLGICRDFVVSVRIRSLERPYSYERSELASALAGLLKDAKLAPALVPRGQQSLSRQLGEGRDRELWQPLPGRTLWRRLDRRREGALGGVQGFPQPVRLQEVQPDEVPAALCSQKAGMRA
ncbi:hypothetical protein [Bradyrhizobium ganzhouense]|uniref:hypothetical protein n=1 Tax=Bradyrhizobium ganzhouense TaxID=1179767 RepID=UPI003CF5FD6F